MERTRVKFASLLAVVAATISGHAALADATCTPFTCNAGQTTVIIDAPCDPKKFGIGTSGKAVTAISDGQQGRSGIDINNINQTFFSIGFNFRDTGNAQAFVNTKFCFTDNLGSFTVQKKLSSYRTNNKGCGWSFAEADSREFATQRVFQATLNRVVAVLNTPNGTPANITFGAIHLQSRPYRDIDNPAGDGDCESANACGNNNPAPER